MLLLFLARLELSKETFEPVLLAENFGQIYMTMSSLNNEVSKIAESILNLDDLYTNLLAVVNSVQNLRRRRVSSLPTRQIYPFENGNIIFEKLGGRFWRSSKRRLTLHAAHDRRWLYPRWLVEQPAGRK